MWVRELRRVVPASVGGIGDNPGGGNMHQHTKLTPPLRKEIFEKWKAGKGVLSLRILAAEYHVDKRVIGRVIERGRRGDFSVHTSTNHRYQKSRSRRTRH